MVKNDTFETIAEMIRATTEDASFARDFEKRIYDRRILKELAVRRVSRGLSQGDIANLLGCTQSRISKLESMSDSDLTIGDLTKYANVFGLRLNILLIPTKTTPVSRAKMLAIELREELGHLTALAKKNQELGKVITTFFSETFPGFIRTLQGLAKKLPRAADDQPPVSFKIHDDEIDASEVSTSEKACFEELSGGAFQSGRGDSNS